MPLSLGVSVLSAAFIVYGSTIPFDFTADADSVIANLSRVTLNPLVSPDTGRFVSIPDLAQNVALFVPFGFFAYLALGDRLRSRANRLLAVSGLAALLALGIEALQLFTTNRTSAVSDLLANTAGGIAGALATSRGIEVWRRWIGRVKAAELIETATFYPLLIATIVLCLAAWEPFDVTLELVNFRQKISALGADLWQHGLPRDEGVELLRYGLFAVAATSWLKAIGMRAPALLTATGGALVAIGLEATQIMVQARMPGLEDAVVHAGGVLAGCAAWYLARQVRSLWFWSGVVITATLLGASLRALGSPGLTTGQSTFEAPSHIVELMLTYFPVGFFLALAMTKSARATVAAIVCVLACAGPIEYLQQWMLGRAPHLSHLPASAVGAVVGVWAALKGREVFNKWVAAL